MNYICTCCNKEDKENFFRCSACGEPMQLPLVTAGRLSGQPFGKAGIFERYKDFFPSLTINKKLSLGEGNTPLIVTDRLNEELGFCFQVKNEGQNPTWSFKDRGSALGVQHAATLHRKKIGTVSTGNMAASVAAYGARAGLKTFVFVSSDIDEEKLAPIGVYQPELIKVEGDYSSLYFQALALGAQKGIYFINSDACMRVEGSKTIAFEICEQMNCQVPDYLVVPVSAGGNFRGIVKGFMEFKAARLIDRLPVFVCAQAAGCSPIYNAFVHKQKTVARVVPETLAHAINNPLPPSGNEVLRLLEKTGGLAVAVTDEELLEAQKKLAREGFFVQLDSAACLAGAIKLKQSGTIAAGAKVVGIATGSGLKYTKILDKHTFASKTCRLEELGHVID